MGLVSPNFPLKSTTSEDVAWTLLEFICRMGIPEEILTDRGSNFCSSLTKELYKMLGIKAIKTAAYHPQTDGMVEKFNGTLKTGIKRFLDLYPVEWNRALPFILFAYRETPHTTTGFTPFELTFGRSPRGPMDVLKSDWMGTQEPAGEDVVFLTKTYQRMETAVELARVKETREKEKMSTYYDRNARLVSFQVGDLVLVLKPSVSKKLLGRWKGPYSIVRKVSGTTYQVQKDRYSKPSTYHVNFLQAWHAPSAVCLLGEVLEEHDLPSWNDVGGRLQPHISTHLGTEKQLEIGQVLERHQAAFSNQPGTTTLAEMVITTGQAHPTSHPPYTIPHSRKTGARAEIKSMLEAGIIRPSKSPWAAPMILVQKKDGSLRPVIDFRRLNKLTQKDPYPIPKIDDMIDLLAAAKYITTLDMKQGYWQIPMQEDSIEKTAFVTPFGKYEFLVMPFGLMGAPAVFQRLMNTLLGDLLTHTAAYMDDIVVFFNLG